MVRRSGLARPDRSLRLYRLRKAPAGVPQVNEFINRTAAELGTIRAFALGCPLVRLSGATRACPARSPQKEPRLVRDWQQPGPTQPYKTLRTRLSFDVAKAETTTALPQGRL